MFGLSVRLVSLFRELSLFAVYPPHSVILRGAEGEVAESIIHQITLALKESSDRCIHWLRARQKHFLIPLIRPDWQLSPWVKVFLRFLKCEFCNSGQALRAE